MSYWGLELELEGLISKIGVVKGPADGIGRRPRYAIDQRSRYANAKTCQKLY
ncbi:MAG: hypothetical protein F6K26_44215 [Moorea sp. SIO2I5]|nr:hypothetical protein [Moorena sp. SIO2I5]